MIHAATPRESMDIPVDFLCEYIKIYEVFLSFQMKYLSVIKLYYSF